MATKKRPAAKKSAAASKSDGLWVQYDGNRHNKRITLTLAPEVRDALEALAEEKGWALSQVVADLVKKASSKKS